MDFGCGPGASSIALGKHFSKCEIVAFDCDERSIKLAMESKGDVPNVEFRCQEIFDLVFESCVMENKFSLVTFFHCLHDLKYPTKALKMAHKILETDGKVLVLEQRAQDEFCPDAKHEFMQVALSVLHCLPCSRAAYGDEPGEDIGNPFRMAKLRQTAENAGFHKVFIFYF